VAVLINRDIILSDKSRHCVTQTVLHDGRQRSTCRYSSFPWVRVHAVRSNVLQSILTFYLSRYKRCRKCFLLTLRHATLVTDMLFVARPKYHELREPTGSD